MKTCSKCKETKQATAEFFGKASRTGDGLQAWCKKCMSVNDKKVKDKLRGGPPRNVWYTYTHLDVVCRKCNETKKLSPENFRNGTKHNGAHIRKTCRMCDNKYTALRSRNHKETYVKARLRDYAKYDKSKGFFNSLSFAELILLVTEPCAYCGNSEEFNGVDRIDGSAGHTLDNVVPACKVCNIVRRDIFTHQIMLDVIGPAVRKARDAGAIVGTGCAPRKY